MLRARIGLRLIRWTSSASGIVNSAPSRSATELSSPLSVLPMWRLCSSCGAAAPTVAVSAPFSARTAPNIVITRARAGPPTRLTTSPRSRRPVHRAGVDRVVPRVAIELLHGLPRLLVAAPEVARCGSTLGELTVEPGEVDVERLGCGPLHLRLHELRVRGEARRRRGPDEIRGVDSDLPVDPLDVLERVGDRRARHSEQQDLGVAGVAPAPSDAGDLVTRLLPQVSQAAADVALADHRDLHPASFG